MINVTKEKTRIKLTWYSAISLVVIILYSIYKEMNDVASAGIGSFAIIVGGYIAGKTWNNSKEIEKRQS